MLRFRRRSKVRGQVDLVTGSSVVGWAMRRSDPGERLTIEVRQGERILASARADLFRADLLAEGIGDGHHGFRIEFQADRSPPGPDAIRVVEAGTGTALALGPDAAPRPRAARPVSKWDLLFDREHYVRQLPEPEAVRARDDPGAHFRTVGWTIGLDPHPLFQTAYYVQQAGGTADEDPITHFLREGQRRMLAPHPVCDVAFYHVERPDVRAAALHPLPHFLEFGDAEGTRMTPFFDGAFYRRQFGQPDVESPLLHYLGLGWRRNLWPHPDFDPALYRRVAGLGPETDAFSHFHADLAQVREWQVRDRQMPELSAATGARIRTSVIVAGTNRALLSLLCLAALRRFTPGDETELIVVDCGSGAGEFLLLARHAWPARVIRLDRDPGLGEARNIGAEAARGEVLVFVERGAFATQGWLEPLIGALEADPGLGAARPRADGDACPAALAVRAESFRRVLGYDLRFDPAAEDDDLVRRLDLIGQGTRAVAQSQVLRFEPREADPVNRVKFEARWGGPRDAPAADDAARPPDTAARTAPAQARVRRIALYSRYPLTPGGGERYLLSLAAALRGDHAAILYTPERHSQARLATLSRELDLPCDHIAIRPWAERGEPPDVFVCMSNEILPSVPAFGRLGLFLCQFPFPKPPEVYAEQWGHLAGYHATLVYSRFVAGHAAAAAAALRLALPPCHVLAPPVPQVAAAEPDERGPDGPFRIVHVGRFSPDGHGKRQDVMVAAFAELAARSPRPVELHLAGALGVAARDRDHVAALREAARGLPVTIHLNPEAARIHALYRSASAYWHMTGAGADIDLSPERFEHFGIAIGEAMSAGAVPISLRHGGPAEIVTPESGFLVDDGEGMCAATLRLIAMGGAAAGMRAAARERARAFSFDAFAANLRAILADPANPRV